MYDFCLVIGWLSSWEGSPMKHDIIVTNNPNYQLAISGHLVSHEAEEDVEGWLIFDVVIGKGHAVL